MQVARRVFVFLLMFWLVSQALPPAAHAWKAEVLNVSDGDSFKVKRDNRVLKVRLYGIDSPEIEQAYGRAARNTARQWLSVGRQVDVEPMYRDKFGRTVALVWAGDKLVNVELVKSGAAWVYPRFCRSRELCGQMEKVQEEARQACLGLWQGEQPEPPWQWKRRVPQEKRR